MAKKRTTVPRQTIEEMFKPLTADDIWASKERLPMPANRATIAEHFGYGGLSPDELLPPQNARDAYMMDVNQGRRPMRRPPTIGDTFNVGAPTILDALTGFRVSGASALSELFGTQPVLPDTDELAEAGLTRGTTDAFRRSTGATSESEALAAFANRPKAAAVAGAPEYDWESLPYWQELRRQEGEEDKYKSWGRKIGLGALAAALLFGGSKIPGLKTAGGKALLRLGPKGGRLSKAGAHLTKLGQAAEAAQATGRASRMAKAKEVLANDKAGRLDKLRARWTQWSRTPEGKRNLLGWGAWGLGTPLAVSQIPSIVDDAAVEMGLTASPERRARKLDAAAKATEIEMARRTQAETEAKLEQDNQKAREWQWAQSMMETDLKVKQASAQATQAFLDRYRQATQQQDLSIAALLQ